MTVKAQNRPVRKPMVRRDPLFIKPREGYFRCWVNEDVGQVEAYLDAGYTMVLKEDNEKQNGIEDGSKLGSVERRIVNRSRDATCHTAVCMEIPQEYRDQDEAAEQLELDEKEKTWNPSLIKNNNPTQFGSMTKEIKGV